MATTLTIPSPALYDSWAECVTEFDGDGLDGSGSWKVDGFGPDRASFDALLEIAAAEADASRRLPEGLVHCDAYWITDPADTVIGFMALRHSLATDFLRTEGGHIGYSVRPSRRRQGHASRALGLVLDRARERQLDRILVTCDESNTASAHTIESQGGVFENHVGVKRRDWITL
ncbi:GNAT family N-acetyltransferase [Mumia sp. zg.B17]|uniref:GNAT family N-acetyltransferase n=1 Tax=Mumia sp. zg.B17 TaxID=2855446 RepID=UPI001C6E2D56|nr:GNAT family N-acetyltransferase [Mumia sp. zg.B17]MBW9205357.1 GNAT family N-acetyltransferase [Mumia sp. zg.B17]